jgi:hypothetical protein
MALLCQLRIVNAGKIPDVVVGDRCRGDAHEDQSHGGERLLHCCSAKAFPGDDTTPQSSNGKWKPLIAVSILLI